MANTLETLIAKQDIDDLLARYARGIDRGDLALLESCYWDDAWEDHGSAYSGPVSDYLPGAVERRRKGGTMMHMLGNRHVEFDGDTAWAETYLLTFARFAKDGEDWDTLTGGRIFDKLTRRDSEWRIQHRKVIFDWNRDAPSNEGWCLGLFDVDHENMVFGRNDDSDLSYSRF